LEEYLVIWKKSRNITDKEATSPMKIGLLEDNPGTIEYLKTALELAGHTVSAHTQGTSLLETLITAYSPGAPLPYDLVLVDLLLPGLSGLEVINRIRQIIPPERLPLIIVSAAASQQELEQVKTRFPTITIVPKPFRFKALLQVIEESSVENTP